MVPSKFWLKLDGKYVTSGKKLLLALHTQIERRHTYQAISEFVLFEPAGSQTKAWGLVLEKTRPGGGEYRRVGTYETRFIAERNVQG